MLRDWLGEVLSIEIFLRALPVFGSCQGVASQKLVSTRNKVVSVGNHWSPRRPVVLSFKLALLLDLLLLSAGGFL